MKQDKPIKRHKSIQPLSREHHHSLLLCLKIRTGFSKNVSQERIKKYADWYFKTYLVPHFDTEEKHVFPILGSENKLVKRALAEHRRLSRLFTNALTISKSLVLIEEELEQHIRFEERVLFNEVQKVATDEQLKIILELHGNEKFNDNIEDPFWI